MRNLDQGHGVSQANIGLRHWKTGRARREAVLQRVSDDAKDSALSAILLVAGGVTLASVLAVVASSVLAAL